MKKVIVCYILLVFLTSFTVIPSANAFSLFKKKEVQEQELEEVDLQIKETEKLQVKKTDDIKDITAEVNEKTIEAQKQAFEIQKKQDVEDITNLWNATVERNSVIKFAINKIDMNPEQRKKHSSKMARTLATLINGAAILPYVFGMDAYLATSTLAGASLATQATKNKLGYGIGSAPISDTELIQLAGLVEDLQNRLIKNYYNYKGSIEALKDCRAKIALYRKNYNKAAAEKSESNTILAQMMLDKQLLEEVRLKNQIKLARIELERFAGEEALNSLNLANIKMVSK
ncbi:MAG: hypothetical protein PHX18_01640 [Candidatus Gastranaerophilales bacterium]|nr:hypothetical protein [Candidatus Gastranaerophilales bacterium]